MTNILKKYTRFLPALFLLSAFWQSSYAQDFIWAPDYPVGSIIPMLEAPDQNGAVQNLGSLSGEKGLVLVFSRSFDWCPFCKVQLDGLQNASADIKASGLNIATITYDPVETLKLVEEDMGITFTMLHDEAIKHVDAYNIRNMGYNLGDFAYGVPQPGIMLVSPQGEILAKFSEENFRVRPDWSDVITAANNL